MVTSHSIHLTSLSKIIIMCVSNPGKGKTRPYCLEFPGQWIHMSWPCQGVSRACLCFTAHMSGQAGSEAHLSGRVLLTWYRATSPRIPSLSSLVSPAAVALAGSQSYVPQPYCVNGTMMLTMHGKDFGIRLALFPPLFNIRFSFAPCHCFQRSRNVDNILKDQ